MLNVWRDFVTLARTREVLLFACFPVVADILCEFLEVAIHLILYVREVYPSGIFQKRKKYNVPVQVLFYVLLLFVCSC